MVTQLLEREPTNMLALRARGWIRNSQGNVADDQLQPSHRLVAAENGARDWTLLSRIDPGNRVSTQNLIIARMRAAEALWDLGRMRESLDKLLALREFEPLAATSTAVAGRLSEVFYQAAILTAELGQVTTAERLLADGHGHLEAFIGGLPPKSFEASFRHASAGVAAELAKVLGPSQRVHAAAKGVRERLLQLQPADAFGSERVAGQLRRLHLAQGWAELQAGDYAVAQGHFSHVAEARKLLPARTLRQRRDATDDSALLAITLARSGRLDEARALAEPALAWQREQQERMAEFPWRHWSLALALLAAAESTPANSRALLAEAQAKLDRLPAEARAARTSQMLQGLITGARRGAR